MGLRRAVASLVCDGVVGKACQRLLSSGVAPIYEEGVWDALRSLHPSRADGAPPLPEPPGEAFDLQLGALGLADWERLTREAVLHFPAGSSAGPSGLRPVHLQECLCPPLLSALTTFVQWCVRPGLPQAVDQFLCASTLVAVCKPAWRCGLWLSGMSRGGRLEKC